LIDSNPGPGVDPPRRGLFFGRIPARQLTEWLRGLTLLPMDPFRPENPASDKPLRWSPPPLKLPPPSYNTDIYPQTRWSQVFAAGKPDPEARQQALRSLYQTYSQPIYCSVRRRGYNHHDAEDLIQAYFCSLISRSYLGKADPAKGKFRAFIQADLKLFLNNEWRKENAPMRKPEAGILSLDELKTGHSYEAADADGLSPDALLDREWAKTTVATALAQAQRSYKTPGQLAVFEALSPLMDKPPSPGMYADIGARLNMTEDTLRVAMVRLRQRFAKAISEVVAETLGKPTPEEVREEIRCLFALLG
jgi:RNA polymerase sigma-70 factor (ECF subfamily)